MHKTREGWLIEAAEMLAPMIRDQGFSDFKPPRISMGFGGRSTTEELGCCFSGDMTKDGAPQIYISPILDPDEPGAPCGILATLLHELCHAALPDSEKHGRKFWKLAQAVGLTGKATATFATDGLLVELGVIASRLGPIPHAAISLDAKPKQGTRMLKLSCPGCGMVIRTTRQWLDQVGAPLCVSCDHQQFEEESDASL